MKILILILLFNSYVLANEQDQMLFCAYREASLLNTEYKPRHDITDKTKHCSISCLVSYRCTRWGAWNIGVYKELLDLLGPGNAEIADLRANSYGIMLSRYIKSEVRCETLCIQKYED